MVRVLCCHHFQSQIVTTVTPPPVCMCSGDGDTLYLANETPQIVVLDSKFKKVIRRFPCLAVSRKISYNHKGGYIASFEEQHFRRETVYSVRCYFNWDAYQSDRPMKVVLAGHMTDHKETSSQKRFSQFMVVEANVKDKQPTCMATCISSSRLAVGYVKTIVVYEPIETTPIDMSMIYTVDLLIKCKDLSIDHDVLGVCSSHNLLVVKICDGEDVLKIDAQVKSSRTKADDVHYSPECDIAIDDNFVLVSSDIKEIPSISIPSIHHSLSLAKSSDIFGPKVMPQFLRTKIKCGSEDTRKRSILLLYRKIKCDDDLHSLQIIRSKAAPNTVSNSVYVSTTTEGYLYDLSGRKVTKTAIYHYTLPATKVVHGQYFVHAATMSRLETLTSRSIVSALHNTGSFDGVTMACPPVYLEPCVVSLQPFMIGLQDIVVLGDRVVLLCRDEASSSSTLYILPNHDVISIYKDMLEYGSRHQAESKPVYHHLLQEANLILRASLLSGQDNADTIKKHLNESCALLGDVYVSQRDSSCKQCLPYYFMSQLTISEILQRQHPTIGKSPTKTKGRRHYEPGLLYYLDHALNDTNGNLTLSENTCNEIVDIYGQLSKSKLALLVIQNKIPIYNKEKAILELQVNKGSIVEPERFLALAILYLGLGEPEEAQAVLLPLTKSQLIELCMKESQILNVKSERLSDIGQLLRTSNPSLFIEIMVRLLHDDYVEFDESVKLLTSHGTALHKNNQLKEYLEAVLSNQQMFNFYNAASVLLGQIYIERLKNWVAPVTRSVLPDGHTHIPKNGHFAIRHQWLNYIEPFAGFNKQKICHYLQHTSSKGRSRNITVSKRPLQVKKTMDDSDVCPCCCCNEDLLKLQALLCSDCAADSSLLETLLVSIAEDVHFKGDASIKLLCLTLTSHTAAIDHVVDLHPHLVAKFATQICATYVTDWQHVLEALSNILRHRMKDDQLRQCYVLAYTEVLQTMCDILDPQTFINLLPSDGLLTYFIPYITACVERQKANKLQKGILNKGTSLLI